MKKALAAATLGMLFLAAPTIASARAAAMEHVPAKTAAPAKEQARPMKHWKRVLWQKTAATEGDREVQALNLLEGAGYRDFTDVVPDGAGFAVTANRRGKLYDVTVASSGHISAKPV